MVTPTIVGAGLRALGTAARNLGGAARHAGSGLTADAAATRLSAVGQCPDISRMMARLTNKPDLFAEYAAAQTATATPSSPQPAARSAPAAP